MFGDPNESGSAPTVVVARHVNPGSEDDFRAWDRRIRAAAAAHAGFLGSEVQEPNPSHPGEWVTVYSFATVEQLDAWLESEDRKALIEEVQGMIDGPGREQHVAGLRTAPEPVTVVFSQRIAPHNEAEFVELHDDVVGRLRKFEGFLGSDLLQPVKGVQDEHVIVASFASRADLDRWLESDSRREWLVRTDQLVEGDRTVNVVGGFGGWFPARPDQPEGPKRWKQSIAVFLALFPTSLIITLGRVEAAPNMNVVLSVFIGNVLGILALTYVLMPRVTRWLGSWLTR
ncbi:MAG: antibiotic biosynthesis monooxygenase [Acidimicrobiia bacterium]|jgi:antibiotic biosynthesis monooxygenase (ABM) superfamily enzyme